MIDIFNPTTMTEALITNFPARGFLTDRFFSDRKIHSTKVVDFDVKKGKRILAPFVSRLHQGQPVERTDLKTLRLEPPYIKPKRITTAEDLLKRQAGEPVFVQDGSNAPAARASMILAEDVTELQISINRRIEWMAAQALFTGLIPVKGEGVDLVIDLLYTNDQKKTLALGARWSESTAQIIKDLTDWKRQIKQLTGKLANTAILGRNAAISLENNATLLKQLDNRRTEAGMIEYRELVEGATYMGFLPKPGLELFTYDEWYVDPDTGNESEMVPENMVLVGSTAAICKRHYGVISDVNAGNWEVESFVKSWTVEDPSARFVMVQSAPLTAIQEPEAFVVAQVQDAET